MLLLLFFLVAGIEPKGKKITLKITDPEDLNRDILKVKYSQQPIIIWYGTLI